MQDKTAKQKYNCFVVVQRSLPPCRFRLDFKFSSKGHTDGLVSMLVDSARLYAMVSTANTVIGHSTDHFIQMGEDLRLRL